LTGCQCCKEHTLKIKLNDKEIKANGYIIKQLNNLTISFLDIFDIDPKINDKIEINSTLHTPNSTLFKGYLNGVNKIKTGYYQSVGIANNKFDKENKDIKCYDDEDIVNIIKDILDLCELKSEIKLDSFNINWIPKTTPILSLNNLFNTYIINKKKKVIWYEDLNKIYIFDKIEKGSNIKNKIFAHRGNVIVCDNENIPKMFDKIEDRIIVGYKLTSKEIELYVR